MQLYLGNNGFGSNAAAVRAHSTVIQARNGQPLRFRTRFDVKAQIYGASQAALTASENNVKGWLQSPFQDLVLRQDDNITASGLALINNTSLSGVRLIDGPHFNEADGPEYVNQRNIEFAMEGEYVFPGAESLIVDLVETISVRGNGGPRYVWMFPFNADAFPQQVSRQSMITTIQHGRIVGHTKYPPVPKPFAGRTAGIFVNEEENPGDLETPEPVGRGFVNYPVSYSYTWRSTKPLGGTPSLPPLSNG